MSILFYKNHTNIDPSTIKYTCTRCLIGGHYEVDCNYFHLLHEGSKNLNNEESGNVSRPIKLNVDAKPFFFNSSKDPIQKDLKMMVEEVNSPPKAENNIIIENQTKVKKVKIRQSKEEDITDSMLMKMEKDYEVFLKHQAQFRIDTGTIGKQITRTNDEYLNKSYISSSEEEEEVSYDSSGNAGHPENSKLNGTDESQVDNQDDTP